MMQFLILKFQAEIKHFLSLPYQARLHLWSGLMMASAYPIFFTFTNAFLFRQTQSFTTVAVYNLAQFITLPVFFLINGYLLKYISLSKLYAAGMMGQGIVSCLIFFYPDQNLIATAFFGALQGMAMSFYWGNRNFVGLSITSDQNRNYYTGLDQLTFTITGAIIPFITGLMINLSSKFQLFTIQNAYQLQGLLGMILLIIGSYYLFLIRLPQPKLTKHLVGKGDQKWLIARLLEIFRGTRNAFDLFLSPLIILTLIGQEISLGTIESLAAIITATGLYIMARLAKPKDRVPLLFYALIALIASSIIFSWIFSTLVAIVYILFSTFLSSALWINSDPITLKTIDEAENGNPTNNYAYVADRELFLNLGRIIGTTAFICLIAYFDPLKVLRFVVLLPAFMQIGFYLCAKKLA